MIETIKHAYNKKFPGQLNKRKFKRIFHKRLDLKNPLWFSEKIQWMKIHYYPHNEDVIMAADKVGLREFIKKYGYIDCTIPLIGVYRNYEDIDWEELPEQFVIKKSAGAGSNIIVKDKHQLDLEKFKEKVAAIMEYDYGSLALEPHYSKMPAKILIEPYIDNIGNDYKVFCFNGIPKVFSVFEVEFDDSSNQTIERHLLERQFFEIEKDRDRDSILQIIREEHFEKIMRYSRLYAERFPFVRVDFYIVGEEVFLGELTFSPSAGFNDYFTKEQQLQYGEWIKIPKG